MNVALPSGWQRVRVRDRYVVTSKPSGLRLDNYERIAFIPMDLMPIQQLHATRYTWKSPREITSGTYFEEGDLLVSKITPCFENGKQGIAEGIPNGFGYATTEVIPVKGIAGESDVAFLSYFLLHGGVRQEMASKMEGATGRQRLPKAVLEDWEMPFPPLSEQRVIIEVLATIQSAIAVCHGTVAALKELKVATMAKLFREGLRGEATKETAFGEIPAAWCVAPLDTCATVQTGIAKGKATKGDVVERPYLRVANVQDGYLDLSEIKHIALNAGEVPRYLLRDGDVLVTEGGDFDKLGRGYVWRDQIPHCVHQNHIFAVRTNREALLPDFFAHLIQSGYGKAYFLKVAHKTTNLACINSTKLKEFPVPLPSIEDQEAISAVIHSIDDGINAGQSRHGQLCALFDTTLAALMSGELRVTPLLEA